MRRRFILDRWEVAVKSGMGENRHEASVPRGEDWQQWAGDIGPIVISGEVGRSDRARGARTTARGSAQILLPLRGVADERLRPGREESHLRTLAVSRRQWGRTKNESHCNDIQGEWGSIGGRSRTLRLRRVHDSVASRCSRESSEPTHGADARGGRCDGQHCWWR